MARFQVMTCRRCSAQEERGTYGRGSYFCSDCAPLHQREGFRASAAVGRAISKGDLAPARECDCTDCGKPASQYDHRDYLQPLEVEPVCRSCNVKRGPAFDSLYRPLAA